MKAVFPYILMLCLSLLGMTKAKAAQPDKMRDVYMFGFATDLNDSTVFMTSVVKINGAAVNKKTGFLEQRSHYSAQLKQFLEHSTKTSYTCTVVYANSRKEAERQYIAMRKHWNKQSGYVVRELAESDFTFVNPE